MTRLTNILVAQRKRLGLSQKELADLIGHSQSSIHRLETGENAPTLETLLALSEVFQVNPGRLYPEESRLVRKHIKNSFAGFLSRYRSLPPATISQHFLRAYERLERDLNREEQ